MIGIVVFMKHFIDPFSRIFDILKIMYINIKGMLKGAALDPKTYQNHVINKDSLRCMLLIILLLL